MIPGSPAGHFLLKTQRCPAPPGQIELALHRALRSHEPSILLKERDRVLVRRELRESLPKLVAVEKLVRQPVLPGAAQAAGHDFAVRRADHETTGNRQQFLLRLALQLAP